MQYTAWHKLGLLTMATRLQDKEGRTLCKAAEHIWVSVMLLLKLAQRFSLNNDTVEAMLKSKKKMVYPGPLSQLKPLENVLLAYMIKQRKQGIEVNTFRVVLYASMLLILTKKHFVAKCSTVKCFVCAHMLVH